MLIFSHSQKSKTLNPEKKKKTKQTQTMIDSKCGIAEKEGQKEVREDNHSSVLPR